MQLTLNIEGKEKTFESGFVPALHYREYLKASKDMDFRRLSEDDYDTLIGLLTKSFSTQFTVDEFWNGVDVAKLDEVLAEFIYFLSGKIKDEGNEKKTE
ncbi:MAG: hypothetical protein WED82_12540 [Balneolales bacterium]